MPGLSSGPHEDAPLRALNIATLVLSLLGLSAMSLVFVYSSTMDLEPGTGFVSFDFSSEFRKQLVFYLMGLVLFFGISRFPYRNWSHLAPLIYALNILLLIYVWQFGAVRGGARSWINLGFTQFQPSETMKTAWLLYLCSWLRYRKNLRTPMGLVVPFIITGVPMVMILRQPDMGTAALFIPTLFTLLFLCGCRKKHLLLVVLFMVLALIPLWFFGLKDYQRSRIMALIDPEAHAQTTAYQMRHSLLAIGEGHWLGKGIGEGRVNRLNLLPESHTDFIFSIIAEELGFLGALVVIALYLTLFFSCLWLGAKTREPFGRHLALGIGTLLIFQTFINLGVTLGVLPTTGITLPFVSSGGSSFVSCCIMLGLVYSVARHHVAVLSKDDFRGWS